MRLRLRPDGLGVLAAGDAINAPPPAAQEKLMALSDAAAREIAKALRKYVGMKVLEQVVTELVEIPGDKDFRDSIESLVDALRTVSDR